MSRARPCRLGARPGSHDAVCAASSHRCAEPRRCGRWTALHCAAYHGSEDVMYELIAAGAVVGLKNNRGYAHLRFVGRLGRPRTGRGGVQHDGGGLCKESRMGQK